MVSGISVVDRSRILYKVNTMQTKMITKTEHLAINEPFADLACILVPIYGIDAGLCATKKDSSSLNQIQPNGIQSKTVVCSFCVCRVLALDRPDDGMKADCREQGPLSRGRNLVTIVFQWPVI